VPERVRDQIQRKYFCERVFRLHQDTTRRDTLEWMTDDERSLGRGANSEGIIKGTGTSLKVEPVGLPPSIRRSFQLVEQSPRVLQW